MPSNVEIKARVKDVERLKTIAAELSGGEAVTIQQEDTFFNVLNGRLKLRKLKVCTSLSLYSFSHFKIARKSRKCNYNKAVFCLWMLVANQIGLDTLMWKKKRGRDTFTKHFLLICLESNIHSAYFKEILMIHFCMHNKVKILKNEFIICMNSKCFKLLSWFNSDECDGRWSCRPEKRA